MATPFEQCFDRSATGCWLWTKAKTTDGYGQKHIDGKLEYAHRLSWKLHRGEIPAGLFVLHKCDVRNCINPEHLFLGSCKDNVLDARAKGRLTRLLCKHGHELTPANTYTAPNGDRECRTCRTARRRAFRILKGK
jgi:hypothetical protein